MAAQVQSDTGTVEVPPVPNMRYIPCRIQLQLQGQMLGLLQLQECHSPQEWYPQIQQTLQIQLMMMVPKVELQVEDIPMEEVIEEQEIAQAQSQKNTDFKNKLEFWDRMKKQIGMGE